MRSRLLKLAAQRHLAAIVLGGGCAIALVAFCVTALLVARGVSSRFEHDAEAGRAAVLARLGDYADALHGLQGLFAASDAVERAEFKRYVEHLDLPQRYPGLRTLAYARRVAHEYKGAFEAVVRDDTSLDPRGYPEFAIKPPGDRPEYIVLQFVEPMEGTRPAFGLDLAGDPVRRAAVDRARDSGALSATAAIQLINDPQLGAAISLRAPIYRPGAALDTVERRREAFNGLVSATVVMDDFMRGIFDERFRERIDVRVEDRGYDDEQPALPARLFDSASLNEAAAPRGWLGGLERATLHTALEVDAGGRGWLIGFRARPGYVTGYDLALPLLVLAGGIVTSLLLYALIRQLSSARADAVELAHRMTEDLRASEARLAQAQRMTQELLEALPIPVFFKDTEGRYLGVNKAWEKYFSQPREDFIGKTVYDLYPDDPTTADAFSRVDRELYRSSGTQVYERSVATPDGGQRETISYKATFSDADGRVAGLIGTIIDITERKQVERALRVSEERFQLAVRGLSVGLWDWNIARREIYFSPRFRELLGFDDAGFERLFHSPDWARLHPDDHAPVMAALAAHVERRAPFRLQYRLKHRSGEYRWFEVHGQAEWNAAGVPVRMAGSIADIGERKHAELRHAVEHQVTRLLADSASLEQAMPRVLDVVCESLDWDWGAHWRWDRQAQANRCVETRADAALRATVFARSRSEDAFAGGALVAQAFARGEPAWRSELSAPACAGEVPLAAESGLRTCCVVPVVSGAEVLGVIELLSRECRVQDDKLLATLRSIGSQVGLFITRRQAEENLLYVATHDTLTRLPNRNMFDQRLGHALKQAARYRKSVAVLFIDLDRFKIINDTLGHKVGDLVLEQLGARLAASLRDCDTVARLGGDEFVVLIEDLADPADVAGIARKLLDTLSRPLLLNDQEYHLTASIGISTYPDDGQDMQSLMKNADIAMYRAKDRGKNNFQFYSRQINPHSFEQLALETDLRHALERDELELHYQPKIELASGRVTGMEALVRWNRPGIGMVAPSAFIPLAEETGLIVPIGKWVLDTACRQNHAWQQAGLPRLRVAVNLSARQFGNDDLLGDIERALHDTGLGADSLELEITESMVMQNPERAVTLLERLRQMGVTLSLDDFGTGYSSLGYLKRFPIDSVKVDRSFIGDLPGDADDAALTRAVIAMAHGL
ncbi:MAG TPA: EAL domain-containing protein, partial [Burkholderiales bacterium]|nr:EAL domain-containing protein [Burkholderiales bacterium]